MSAPLRVERIVGAVPDRVWLAFTTPDGLRRWWWPHLPGTTHTVDLRPGGHYRLENVGAGIGVRGEFETIDTPHRFSATWIWLNAGIDGIDEHVDVRFEPHPDGTRLVILHTGPWSSPEPAEAYALGWRDTLDVLVAQLNRGPA
ncbi:MAG: SRPBCC domain-containing protein [Actinomycetota bacterium]|nr:SRPBCC domain-containing protein [Actinomycetota bacterium]